ncbi:MAG TPA: HTTM domain-containing protein [Pirellulaceae bacterium]|nr:HTTM domain-containing protein [Pirellulaceae bacterium]
MSGLPNVGPRLVSAWNRFFHADVDLRACAVVRIGYAALVLVWLAVLYPDLSTWYGEEGVLPLATAEKTMPGGAWTLLAIFPKSLAWLYAAYAMAIVHALLLLAGFASRLNAAALWVWIVSFCHRNEVILDAEDTVFRLIGFFLVLMPAGAGWRLRIGDCGLRIASSPIRNGSPAWALRLLQIQMCVIFLSAAAAKLESAEWRDGTAMFYVSRLTDYFGRFPAPDFLWQTPWCVRTITWGVIAAELAIPVLIWLPPARRWALAAAVAFHLANEYTMHLFLFHWIMLVGWASFLTGDDLDAIGRLVGRPFWAVPRATAQKGRPTTDSAATLPARSAPLHPA